MNEQTNNEAQKKQGSTNKQTKIQQGTMNNRTQQTNNDQHKKQWATKNNWHNKQTNSVAQQMTGENKLSQTMGHKKQTAEVAQ